MPALKPSQCFMINELSGYEILIQADYFYCPYSNSLLKLGLSSMFFSLTISLLMKKRSVHQGLSLDGRTPICILSLIQPIPRDNISIALRKFSFGICAYRSPTEISQPVFPASISLNLPVMPMPVASEMAMNMGSNSSKER